MSSSNISAILRSLSQLDEPIRVSGASEAGRAFIAARCSQAEKPLIVFCRNDEAASSFAQDIESLSTDLPVKVLHFPTWERPPYGPVSLSLKTRFARISVLSALLRKPPGPGDI